jgi:hypothetical protein
VEPYGSRRRVFFEVAPDSVSHPLVQLLEIVRFRDDAFADGLRDVASFGGILDDKENLGRAHQAQHSGHVGPMEIPPLTRLWRVHNPRLDGRKLAIPRNALVVLT